MTGLTLKWTVSGHLQEREGGGCRGGREDGLAAPAAPHAHAPLDEDELCNLAAVCSRLQEVEDNEASLVSGERLDERVERRLVRVGRRVRVCLVDDLKAASRTVAKAPLSVTAEHRLLNKESPMAK
jgi:hypothetical protein